MDSYIPYHRRRIDSVIKRNHCTVSRKLNRNKSNEIYSPFESQKQYEYNKKSAEGKRDWLRLRSRFLSSSKNSF